MNVARAFSKEAVKARVGNLFWSIFLVMFVKIILTSRQQSINQTQRQNKRGPYLWLSLTNNIHPISQNKRTVQPTCLSTKVPASACAPTTQEHSPPQGQANILLKL